MAEQTTEKRGRGRPPGNGTKMTPDAIKRIADALSMGATYELAARYAGMVPRTIVKWKTRGEDVRWELEQNPRKRLNAADLIALDLVNAMAEAESRAAMRWLAAIERAAEDPRNWTAAAWKLERRWPEFYGRRAVEISGRNGDAVQSETTVNVKQQIEVAKGSVLASKDAYAAAQRIRLGLENMVAEDVVADESPAPMEPVA